MVCCVGWVGFGWCGFVLSFGFLFGFVIDESGGFGLVLLFVGVWF